MGASRFHEGELAAQERVGVREQMAGVTGIRDFMPDQHRQFFGELPFFFAGALDEAGQPWATLLAGAPGFVTAPDPRVLRIAGGLLPGDPLQGRLLPGRHLGGLGLAPTTRRRNRVNGVIASAADGVLEVDVLQSFGNCPQYIQHRGHAPAAPRATPLVERRAALDARDRALVARADTFFIASASTGEDGGQARGVDVSHRGGRPGFVLVEDDHTLAAPDFIGNFFFNTIGNLLHDPRAGLLFIDFENGDLLHLAVDATIVWDGPEVAAFAGAERLLRFTVREVVRNVGALPFRWSEAQPAAQLARTGDWDAAKSALQAAQAATAWRPFETVDVVRESADVLSFHLAPRDGLGLAPHVPGQFVTLRLPDGRTRSYTLSDAPDGRRWRISVKRGDGVSRRLHDDLAPGAQIEVMGPGGDFTFAAGTRRPAVFLSAGIGITPMIAMLNGLLVNGDRTRHRHPIHFLHGARNPDALAFGAHLRALAAGHRNLRVHVRYSAAAVPVATDDLPNWDESAGRVDVDLLRRVLPFDDYDFYLCGPGGFMQAMYDGLRALNVADERIRFEAFGPASVRRTAAAAPAPRGEVQAVPVHFARSGVDLVWDGSHANLLELAEAHGIDVPSSCRSGMCGTCEVGVRAGRVEATRAAAADAAQGHARLCCAVPRAGSEAIVLDA
ncbi:pyridoxamine 5'-phosphate oxidase family protein [uncultured Massilia sp.]|uniref:2Fe-2S iron-sulfur cluster-binding protein n=1 Tax=uncultured Massilia sp. TaxID=169973 RepID=UPI0025D610D5|nr:pyridoxamine 5'-phosphate oxidase family protein [uncultured Massilia sp.]